MVALSHRLPRETAQSANKGSVMTERSLDELGPVDYLVVEFPAGASNFTGEMAAELLALVDSGTIRVIDILILTKNQDGVVEAMELADVGELGQGSGGCRTIERLRTGQDTT
jgi:hypothetical protein